MLLGLCTNQLCRYLPNAGKDAVAEHLAERIPGALFFGEMGWLRESKPEAMGDTASGAIFACGGAPATSRVSRHADEQCGG